MIAVLVVSAMLMAVGIIGVRTSRLEVKIAANDLMALKALYVAEAGLDHAFSAMQRDQDGFDDELASAGTAGALSSIGGTVTVAGINYRFRHFGGNRASDGYYVRVIDNFDETVGANDGAVDADSTVKVVSLGKMAGAERIVKVTVTREPLFVGAGLVGTRYVKFGGGAVVDSYSAADGPYPNEPSDQGNVKSNGDVTLGGDDTTVNGSATAGGIVDAREGAITGDIVEGADPFELEPVSPCGPPYSDGGGITGGEYNPTNGQLKAKGSESDITLASGVYCFSSVTIGSGNTFTVNDAVQMFLTDKSSFGGGSIVNTTLLPANFQIYSSYVSDGIGLTLSGGAQAAAVVYAPDSGIKVTGGGEFFGGFVGDSIDFPGTARFHYDIGLDELRGWIMSRAGWTEVRGR